MARTGIAILRAIRRFASTMTKNSPIATYFLVHFCWLQISYGFLVQAEFVDLLFHFVKFKC